MEISNFRQRCCSFFITLVSIMLVGAASTVYASELELNEGDPGGNIVNDGDTDWEDLFNPGSIPMAPTPKGTLPTDYNEAVFVRDFVPGKSGPDETTFATGSKDTLNITPGWECTRSNNVNDKTDIVNAYATAYVVPDDYVPGEGDATEPGDVIVYFALERYSNEGTGNVGFWFLQDGSVGCVIEQGKSGSFTGNHVDGDTLIVSEFSNGGAVATIEAYRWVGGAAGALDPTPVGSGSECIANDDSSQNLCGVVNKELIPDSEIPWRTETKQPGNTPSLDLDVSEFFEGKINLTDLGLEGCFSKYMAVTRSSTSLTATIFDYALGDFNLCSIDVTKQCSDQQTFPPVVNQAGDKVITSYDIILTNDGAGALSDLTITEHFDNCKLVAVTGGTYTGSLPVSLTKDTAESVIDTGATLPKDGQITARVECEGPNGLLNSATGKANPAVGGSTLSQTYTMMSNQACPLTLSPMVTLKKMCDGVRLADVSGILSMLVNVDVSIKNDGAQALEDVDVNNFVGTDTSGTGTVIPLYYADSAGNYVDGLNSSTVVDYDNRVLYPSDGASEFSIAPGATVYFRSEYNPSDTVIGIGTNDDPGSAFFDDTVTATGRGAISGTFGVTPAVTAYDSCPLCPPEE